MTLPELWDQLAQVRSLSFVAQSAGTTGWNGKGIGSVEVRLTGEGVLTFHESGSWRPEGGERDIRFTNVYRWTLADGLLRLEHLRFGEAHPVYLFDLAQVGEREWRPTSPHQCSEDCYSALLLVREDGVGLCWSIEGPKKQERIEYLYSRSRAKG